MQSSPDIHRGMRVLDIVTLVPGAAEIMAEYGLHCFSCSVGGSESLEEGCGMHGFTEEMIDELVDDLNQALLSGPERPRTITVTPEAAAALMAVAETESKKPVIEVLLDSHGGFCMEIREDVPAGMPVFPVREVPALTVYSSPLTLRRIGGAVIGFREGRFKLDLPDAPSCCGDGSGTGCGCH